MFNMKIGPCHVVPKSVQFSCDANATPIRGMTENTRNFLKIYESDEMRLDITIPLPRCYPLYDVRLLAGTVQLFFTRLSFLLRNKKSGRNKKRRSEIDPSRFKLLSSRTNYATGSY